MNNPASIEKIAASLQSFKQLLDPSLRDHVQMTDVYRVRSQRGYDVHWPKNWEDVWGQKATSGVYLHFDEDDKLLYIGKAVSLTVRLNNYYKYVDYPRDMSCYVKDGRLLELGGSGIRVIILDGPQNVPFFGPRRPPVKSSPVFGYTTLMRTGILEAAVKKIFLLVIVFIVLITATWLIVGTDKLLERKKVPPPALPAKPALPPR